MSALDWIAKHSALAWIGSIGLCFSGAVVAMRMPSGIYPEIEFPRIVVVAKGGDAPADLTQIALTRPLETELATVLGLERIRSRTIRGAAELDLIFAPSMDMWRALQLVESRVGEARAELPPGVDIVVERLTTTSFPVITFNLTGDVDPRRLREIGELIIRPALSRVRGVGGVEVLGGDVREMEVILDPAQSASLHLGPSQVAEAVKKQSVLEAVGRLNEAHSLTTVMLSSEPRDRDDLAALPIQVGPDGSPIPLSAIAKVEEGAEDRLLRVSGPGGETVLISVSRLPGASTSGVVAAVREAMHDLEPTLPKGLKAAPVYDQALLVDESIRTVRDAILLGIALCVAVIALFLGDLRGGLVAALALPLTLGMTFLPSALLGHSLNLMSLGGLAVAIGLVIDDAIVVVESIRRRMEDGEPISIAWQSGVRDLLGPLIGTTATTVIVFVPLAGMRGVVGDFFVALAATLSSAVILSLAIALVIVPLAASRFMRPIHKRESVPRYVNAYTRVLKPVLERPWIGLSISLLLFGLGVGGALFVPSGFLPTMDEGAFVLDYFLPAGTSLEDTDAAANKIEAILRRIPEVETYSRRTGAELGPATATQVNTGDIMVRLKRERDRSADDVISDARGQIEEEVHEARVEFVQVLQDVLNDLSGTARPIEIKLFGEDYRILQSKAAEIAERLEGLPRLVDLYVGFDPDAPELRFRVDASAAARMGKTSEEIAADLDTALHGAMVGTIRRPDRPIGVRVRYPDSVRFNAGQLADLPILAGAESFASISAVAKLEREGTPQELLRENLRSMVVVEADYEGGDLGSIVRDVQARLRGVRLPEGYRMELGGQYEGQQKTFRELLVVMGFGLLAVLLVLLAQFERARLALVIVASVPLAVVGALVTLLLTGIPLNASSLMGCVLLVGLVVKNGILLLEQAERAQNDGASVEAALLHAGTVRLRPILMTTVATIAGLFPLALGFGSGAELQRPLAVAVIGGLVVSTAVSLILLPSLVRIALRRDLA